MKNKIIFYFIVLTSIGILSGCNVAGVRPMNMSPSAQSYDQLEYHPQLEHRIAIGSVSVSEQAQRATIVPITQADLQAAIATALRSSGYLTHGSQDGELILHAVLTNLDAPSIGFSLTTAATIHYTLSYDKDDRVVWEETIMIPYTAEFSESFNGEERLRLSIEKTIRENVTHMLVALSNASIPSKDNKPAVATSTATPTQKIR
jgi:hypothetical protein